MKKTNIDHYLFNTCTDSSNLPPGLIEALQRIVTCERLEGIESAIRVCHEVLIQFPDQPQILHYLGAAALFLDQPLKALEYLNKAIELGYEDALLYNHAGIAHCKIGQLDQGINLYQHALSLNSEVAQIYYNLGNTLIIQNKIEQAIAQYQKALDCKPNYLECAHKLGDLLLKKNSLDEALIIFKSIISFYPDSIEIHFKTGLVYYYLEMHKEAVPHLENALDLATPTVFLRLGYCYHQQDNFDKQISLYKRGLELFPDNFELMIEFINASKNICLWDDLDKWTRQAVSVVDRAKYLIFGIHILLNLNLDEELQFAKIISRHFLNKTKNITKKFNVMYPRLLRRNKIRIGYVSSNIRNHPNSHLIMSMFPNHDKSKFEIYLYSTGPRDESYYSKQLPILADKFEDLYKQDLESCATKIYEDEIDILVDLTGHLRFSPAAISALRVAPLQIRLLGSCGTNGSDFVDYLIVDKNVVLPTEDQYYSEKLIYMPNTYFITDNQQHVGKNTTKREHGLPEDRFIFCCFNESRKLESATFNSWINILQRVPNSVLWLLSVDKIVSNNILEHAKKFNIDCNRIIFAPRLPKDEHLARLKLADLFLDCFYHSAHTTAIDALWVDLPLLTCFGKNIAQRGASSILQALGMSELIVTSIKEYEDKATYYATHLEALNEIKFKIIHNKKIMPLFDTALYVNHLEQGFIKALELYEQGKKEHIFV